MPGTAPDTGHVIPTSVADVQLAPEFAFPADTPIADMTPEEQAEYWREKAQAHEKQWKAVKNTSEATLKRDLAATRRELDGLKQASMSDQEKAVEQAKREARIEAAHEFGSKIVDAEVRAAAAGRDVDVDALLEGLDRTRFVDDDGEPKRDEIVAWVDRIAPVRESNGQVLDLGQGTRTAPLPLNGDPIERALKAKLGIR